jgi:hypothetical protein
MRHEILHITDLGLRPQLQLISLSDRVKFLGKELTYLFFTTL